MWPRSISGVLVALAVVILCTLAGAAIGAAAAQAIKLSFD